MLSHSIYLAELEWQGLPCHLDKLLLDGPAALCDCCEGPLFQDGSLTFRQIQVADQDENLISLHDQERPDVKHVWASLTFCNKYCSDHFQLLK